MKREDVSSVPTISGERLARPRGMLILREGLGRKALFFECPLGGYLYSPTRNRPLT